MMVYVRGLQFHIETTAGSGPALLALHGFTGAGSNWADHIEAWRSRFRVICIDVIGHGKTDAPADAGRYTIQKAVADIAVILDELSIHSVHLLGYSMGGRLALAFAVYYPERVSSLLLESSSPGLRRRLERCERARRDEALADKIESEGITAFIDHWEQLPLFATQSEETRIGLRRQRLQNNPTGLANSLRGMGTGAQGSFWEDLPALHLPVLYIAGRRDTKFCGMGREMVAALPNARLVTVPEAGHTVHVEQSCFFDKIVEDWMIKNEGVE